MLKINKVKKIQQRIWIFFAHGYPRIRCRISGASLFRMFDERWNYGAVSWRVYVNPNWWLDWKMADVKRAYRFIGIILHEIESRCRIYRPRLYWNQLLFSTSLTPLASPFPHSPYIDLSLNPKFIKIWWAVLKINSYRQIHSQTLPLTILVSIDVLHKNAHGLL